MAKKVVTVGSEKPIHPILEAVMKKRKRRMTDFAKCTGKSASTIWEKMQGNGEWSLNDAVKIRELLEAESIPLEILFLRDDEI